jgi:hypothetical protein
MGKFHGVMSPTTPSGSWNEVDAAGYRNGGPVELVDGAGVVVKNVGHRRRLPARAGHRLTDVVALERGQFVFVCSHDVGEAP